MGYATAATTSEATIQPLVGTTKEAFVLDGDADRSRWTVRTFCDVSIERRRPETIAGMPSSLAEIAADFRDIDPADRLQLLLEFSDELPGLPQRYADAPEKLEQVHECQSPLFLAVEVGEDAGVATEDQKVSLFFSAPPEAPTTRGFAGILHEGLDGRTVAEVLAAEDQAPMTFGLAEVVSPLRMRGMVAMLSRIKRQVRLRTSV